MASASSELSIPTTPAKKLEVVGNAAVTGLSKFLLVLVRMRLRPDARTYDQNRRLSLFTG